MKLVRAYSLLVTTERNYISVSDETHGALCGGTSRHRQGLWPGAPLEAPLPDRGHPPQTTSGSAPGRTRIRKHGETKKKRLYTVKTAAAAAKSTAADADDDIIYMRQAARCFDNEDVSASEYIYACALLFIGNCLQLTTTCSSLSPYLTFRAQAEMPAALTGRLTFVVDVLPALRSQLSMTDRISTCSGRSRRAASAATCPRIAYR